MIVLLDVPETFKGVAAVDVERGSVRVTERSNQDCLSDTREGLLVEAAFSQKLCL